MKHLKFISAFLVAFALLLACVPVQASADEDEYDLQKINVLDYGYPNGGSSNKAYLSSANNFTAIYTLPFQYPIIFVDVIFEPAAAISSVGVRGSSGYVDYLTYNSLENGLYRATGQLSRYFGSGIIGFTVLTSSGVGLDVTIHRFDLYTYTNQGVGDIGEMNIIPNADTSVSTDYWYRQSSPGFPIVQDFYYFSQAVQFHDYQVLFSSVNWRKYDYLDFAFTIDASTISSISAYVKTSSGVYRYLPFDISFLNGTAIDKNEFVGSGSTTVIPAGNAWDIVMRVYIPSSYRLSGSLYIQVEGEYKNPADRALLQSVNGYYYLNVPDPELVKLDQMIAAIKESLSSSEEDNAAAEDFSENMASQKEQMASNQQTLNNVSKPSSEDLGMMASPDAVLNADGMTALVSIINPITDNDLVLGILTLSATLALVSYVFFGKKR